MSPRRDAQVLTFDVSLTHNVDTKNVENVHRIGKAFSRCDGSLEMGRRLENLSWRVWNGENFCSDPASEANATTPAISTSSRGSEDRYFSTDVPDLSRSLGSVVDEGALDSKSDNSSLTSPVDSRSRGHERHITPSHLQMIVSTIVMEKENFEQFALSGHSCLAPLAECKSITSDSNSGPSTEPAGSKSATSGCSVRSTTSVVRGFSSLHVSTSFGSIPLLNAPSSIPTTDIAAANTSQGPAVKKQMKFTLGGSSGEDSLSEQQGSIGSKVQAVQAPQHQKKKNNSVFHIRGSSNEEENSLMHREPAKSAHTESIQKLLFKEEVATRTIREEQTFDDDVFETDEDDFDESAIDDDDDSSDWEDLVEGSGNGSIDEKAFFRRVDSRPSITSRRSLITTMLHQNDRTAALTTAASKSTATLQRTRASSPNGPSFAASPDSDKEPLIMKKRVKPSLGLIAEIPRSAAQPIIMTTTNTTPHQLALSPRTTRRNIFTTELTVSLRQGLLWERQQQSKAANVVPNRTYPAHDIANLKQYPKKVHIDKEYKAGINASWNQYFSVGCYDYHSTGW